MYFHLGLRGRSVSCNIIQSDAFEVYTHLTYYFKSLSICIHFRLDGNCISGIHPVDESTSANVLTNFPPSQIHYLFLLKTGRPRDGSEGLTCSIARYVHRSNNLPFQRIHEEDVLV